MNNHPYDLQLLSAQRSHRLMSDAARERTARLIHTDSALAARVAALRAAAVGTLHGLIGTLRQRPTVSDPQPAFR